MQDQFIFHIVTNSQWAAQVENESYTHDSLAAEGFIHCSTQQQLHQTIKRYYADQTTVLVLKIEASKINALIKYELAPSVNEYFPHIFGVINKDAIVEIITIEVAAI
jgi:uncharacterized protein (DUF952 family)